jgi:hypothetical protein
MTGCCKKSTHPHGNAMLTKDHVLTVSILWCIAVVAEFAAGMPHLMPQCNQWIRKITSDYADKSQRSGFSGAAV